MIRVLLDENLPRKLKGPLDAENATVPERGWGGIKNGDPLRIAEKAFDVLLTVDKGLRYRQNLSARSIAVLVLAMRRERISPTSSRSFQPPKLH